MSSDDPDKPEIDSFKIKPRPQAMAPAPVERPGGGGRHRFGLIHIIGILLAATAALGPPLVRLMHPPALTPKPALTPALSPAIGADGASATEAGAPQASASASAANPVPPAGGLLLRIHGSNTIGEALMPELVKAFLTHQNYTGVHVEPGDSPHVSVVIGQRRDGPGRVEIEAAGSETGFPDLAAGSADIAMSSEKISAAQLASLKSLGDLSTPAGEHVIGLDGVTIIVHSLNPVSELDLGQLADVFSGAVKDWAALRGPGGPIQVYARDGNSGTWRIFNEMVLQPLGKQLAPNAQRFASSQGLLEAVARDPHGIGLIGWSYVGTNKAVAISAHGVEARLPALCTLKTDEYLLRRRLYLYTATAPPPLVTRFIELATSAEAWPIVTHAGFVNLDPTPQTECNSPGNGRHSAEYLTATRGAQRLLTNFNFLPGTSELDSKSMTAIGHLSHLLASPAYAGRRVLLLGYADDSDQEPVNRRLSLQRANAVRERLAARLRKEGLNVPIRPPQGLGAQELLAPRGTPEGSQRNRRVEVWLVDGTPPRT